MAIIGPRRLAILFLVCGALTVSMVLPFSPASAEETEAIHLSFQDAIRMAKERHVEAIVANERVQQAVARLGQSASVLLPQITASASQDRLTRNLKSFGIPQQTQPTLPGTPPAPAPNPVVGPFNSFDARFTLKQQLFDIPAIERLRAARKAELSNLALRQKAQQDAMALVANFYVEAERAEDAVALVRSLLERDAERLRLARTRLENGTGSELELKQAQAGLASSQGLWDASLHEALERKLDLTSSLGLPNDRPVIFEDREILGELPENGKVEITPLVSAHPEVEAARELVKQYQLERGAELAEFLPKASGSLDYGASGAQPSDSESTYGIGARVDLPLFEGGNRFFRVREASSRLRQGKAELRDTESHVEARLLDAIEAMNAASTLVLAKDAEFAAEHKASLLAEHRLKIGTGSELEVLEAAADKALARDQMNEALAQYRMSEVNLAHAMGHVEKLIEEETL